MANKADHENAAKKKPSDRTVEEQALASEGVELGIGDSRNLDFYARQNEKYPTK